MLAQIIALDHWLFFLVNNQCSTPILDPVCTGLSAMGGWTIGLLALALLSERGWRVVLRHAVVVLACLLLANVCSHALKTVVDRDRPRTAFSLGIAAGRVRVNLLDPQTPEGHSFPSGHAMLSFFLMTYVGQWRPRHRPYLLVLAAGIALSRVYVGVHFPADCVAGAALGAGFGLLAWWSAARLFPASQLRLP